MRTDLASGTFEYDPVDAAYLFRSMLPYTVSRHNEDALIDEGGELECMAWIWRRAIAAAVSIQLVIPPEDYEIFCSGVFAYEFLDGGHLLPRMLAEQSERNEHAVVKDWFAAVLANAQENPVGG